MIGYRLRGLVQVERMDATPTSNLFIVILVTAVISALITEEKNTPAAAVKNNYTNTLITQQIFRQCGNSPQSTSVCIKLIDDLVEGVITKDEFLNYIKHPRIEKIFTSTSSTKSL